MDYQNPKKVCFIQKCVCKKWNCIFLMITAYRREWFTLLQGKIYLRCIIKIILRGEKYVYLSMRTILNIRYWDNLQHKKRNFCTVQEKLLKLQTKQSKAKSKTPQQNREGMHGHTISYITLTSNSLVLGGTKGPQQ